MNATTALREHSTSVPPSADAVAGKAAKHGTLASDWIVYAPLVATTVFSKFSIPPLADRGLGIGLPLVFLTLGLGLALNRVRFHGGRLCYFSLLIVVLGAMQMFHQRFSVMSFVYLTAVCFAYTLLVPRANGKFPESANVFMNMVLFICLCGIAQFLLQFIAGKNFAFPIETFTPKGFIVEGFNYLNRLSLNSSIFKSNGLFLLEASFFSQLLAIGIVTELASYQRVWRLVLLALGMTFSYSGTGILVLACGLPIVMLANRRADLVLVFVAVAMLAFVFAEPLRLDIFLGRVGEFSSTGSSASMRFTSWLPLFKDVLFNDSIHTLIGYGAGSFLNIASLSPYPVAEIMHAKIFIEYGLLGGGLYIGFLFYCIFSASAPLAVKVVVLVLHFMSGAYSEPVVGIALGLLLLTPPRPATERPYRTVPAEASA